MFNIRRIGIKEYRSVYGPPLVEQMQILVCLGIAHFAASRCPWSTSSTTSSLIMLSGQQSSTCNVFKSQGSFILGHHTDRDQVKANKKREASSPTPSLVHLEILKTLKIFQCTNKAFLLLINQTNFSEHIFMQ